MSDEQVATLRWSCPECTTELRVLSTDLEAARDTLEDTVREHLASMHPDDQVNAYAASSWLAAAGHLVELWGGSMDGATLWLPPGQLPPVIGVTTTPAGAVVPVRAAVAQQLPHVHVYRCGETAGRTRIRYLHDARWAS